MEISLFFQRLSWGDFLSIIRPNKKVRPCEQPHLQGRESKGAPLLLGRYVAHVAALGLALLFLQGHALLVHHPLEEAGLLLFGGGEHGPWRLTGPRWWCRAGSRWPAAMAMRPSRGH